MADLPFSESGDIWLNRDTKTLKYNIDGTDYTQPSQTWLVAGEAITAGDFVSVGNAAWTGTTAGKVYATDSELTDKVIGIALNTTTVDGDPIEIQREGLYTYSSAPACFAGNTGKTVYVADTPDGSLTTDRDTAALDGNNLLSVGQIVSANKMVIKLEGDSRGPLGYTENQYTLGEDITTAGDPLLMAETDDGKVYLASKQKSVLKTNVVGFLVNTGTLLTNAKVIIRRLGLVQGFTGLVPGSPVYASGTDIANFGETTQNINSINPYYDSYINVGLALSATEIIASIQPAYDITDTAPLGTISLIDFPTQPTSDSGCLLMDGTAYDAVTNPEYQALYDVIGNLWGGIDNTDFILKDMNTLSAEKYQIKYKAFGQNPSFVTAISRVEYPSNTTWETYNPATNPVVDISTLDLTSADQFKELSVRMYAYKSAVGTYSIPDLFQFTNITDKVYGYTYEYIDLNSIRIRYGAQGLAYSSGTGVNPIDNTWTIKIIVSKTDRVNRYLDSTTDYKINTLFGSKISDENLRNYYSFDNVRLIPDSPTNRNYLQDVFATTDSFTGSSANLSVSNGELVVTSTVNGPFRATRTLSFDQKYVRLKIRNVSGSRVNYGFYYTISSTEYNTAFVIENGKSNIVDLVLLQADTATEFSIRANDTASTGDSFAIDWIYIGTGAYTSELLDDSNNMNNASMVGVLPVSGMQGRALKFKSGSSVNFTSENFTTNTSFTMSCWFSIPATSSWSATDKFSLFSVGSLTASKPYGIIRDSTNNIISAYASDGTSELLIPFVITRDTWYHAVMIYNGSTRKLSFYMNNIYVGETSTTLSAGVSFATTDKYLGNNTYIKNNVGSTYYYEGMIDEARIYNKALTQPELNLLFNEKSGEKVGAVTSSLTVISTTDTTSEKEAALTVWGGASIGKSLLVKDTTYFSSYTGLNLYSNATNEGFLRIGTNTEAMKVTSALVTLGRDTVLQPPVAYSTATFTVDSTATTGSASLALKADSTYSQGFLVTRNNTANGITDITHKGTGALNIGTVEASDFNLKSVGVPRLQLLSTGITNFVLDTDATSSIAGSVTLAGGLASAKKIYSGLGFFRDTAASSTGVVLGGAMATSDAFRIATGGAADAGWLEIATADNGTEPIYVRQYSDSFTTAARTLTLLDGSGNTTIPGTLNASGGLTVTGTLVIPSTTSITDRAIWIN